MHANRHRYAMDCFIPIHHIDSVNSKNILKYAALQPSTTNQTPAHPPLRFSVPSVVFQIILHPEPFHLKLSKQLYLFPQITIHKIIHPEVPPC